MLNRETLPGTRGAITKAFKLPYRQEDGTVTIMKLYFTVGRYDDGRIGEVFIKADRSGSLANGALDAVATMMSIALQHGVPLHTMLDKLRGTRFEPQGSTGGDKDFPSTTSPLDLLAKWLTKLYPVPED